MTAFPLGPVTERARTSPSSRGWGVLAVLSVAVATGVSVLVALSATRPAFPFDEIDQLQMSRLLVGLETPEVRGAGYFPGWSLIIAPLWWLTSDPFVVYGAAIAIGLVLGLLAIIPMTLIARRFRLTTAQGITASALVVTLPAVAIQADYALSERLLLLTVALVVLTAWRLWERPSMLRGVVLAVMLALMYLTHVRMLVIVLAAGIWLVLFALRNWKVAIVALIATVVLALAVRTASTDLNVLLLGQFSQGENLMQTLRESRPGLLLRSALGQAWTQVVGTLGLAAVGFIALVVWSWKELRRLRAGRATFLLAIILASYALTTIKWASDFHLYTRPWRRLDIWLYGRYIDPITVLLVMIALALIIRGIRRSTVLWAGGLSLAVILPTVFWVAREAPTWAYVTAAHIPGVTPWHWLLPDERFPEGTMLTPTFTNENRFWVYASLSALVALLLVLLLRRRRKTLTVLFLAAFSAMSLSGDGASDHFREIEGTLPVAMPEVREALNRVGPIDIAFERGCDDSPGAAAVTLNYYGYWMLPGILRTVDSIDQATDADVVFACDAPLAPAPVPDAVPVSDWSHRSMRMWVAPGPLLDALQDVGAVPRQ